MIPQLDVQGLWKSYGPAADPVVRDVSFTLDQGRFLTLLGPSGSGKTTTLMMVAGFEAPNAGRILARGEDISALPANRRNFGVVFQGYALFPHMSVQDNVEFALRMRGLDPGARRKRALDMLDKVGLAAFAARRPRELSGGQQQRVALARALVFEPDILLLDEPLGALDKTMRATLQAEIKDIQRKTGVSVLFITHDQEEAMMMSDVIAVMQAGEIAQIGTPEDVYSRPADRFVAAFLGETNLLPCEVCGVDGTSAQVRLADGSMCQAVTRGLGLQASAKALVSLRPETLKLLAPGEVADNMVEAQILDRVFLGQQVRYALQAVGQTLIAVGPPGAAHSSERIRVGWSHEAGQLLAP